MAVVKLVLPNSAPTKGRGAHRAQRMPTVHKEHGTEKREVRLRQQQPLHIRHSRSVSAPGAPAPTRRRRAIRTQTNLPGTGAPRLNHLPVPPPVAVAPACFFSSRRRKKIRCFHDVGQVMLLARREPQTGFQSRQTWYGRRGATWDGRRSRLRRPEQPQRSRERAAPMALQCRGPAPANGVRSQTILTPVRRPVVAIFCSSPH